MRLTLVLFLAAWLQIYGNSAVLSLPPSLIANAASIRQLQQQQQQRQEQQVWSRARAKEQQQAAAAAAAGLPLKEQWPMKKDAMAGVDGSADSNRLSHNSNIISNSKNNLLTSNRVMPNMKASANNNNNNNNNDNDNDQEQQQQQARNLYKLPNEYEINSLLANAAAAAAAATQQDEQQLLLGATELATDLIPQQQQQSASATSQSQSPSPPAIAPRIREIEWNEFFTPMKYWARHCQPTVDDDCPAKYALQQQQNRLHAGSNSNTAAALGDMQPDSGAENEADAALSASNDILTLLNGEEDLIKFLHWAMQQLQPFHNYDNLTKNGVTIDMNLWKKLNLSGQREPLLFVEEPRYVIVRREQGDDENFETRLRLKSDPFIPPRGRKYQQMPELEKLLHRYETFVPNRGKRDKIKDIFKYDDLFFPNRGKKQKPTYATTAGMRQQNDVAAADDDDDDDEDFHVVDTHMLPSALWPLHKLWRNMQADCLQHVAAAGADGQPLAFVDINGSRRICYNNKMHDIAIDDDNDDVDDEADAWPRTSMSAYDVKINEYDQSVKTSMPTTSKEMSTAAGAIKNPQKLQQQQRQWSNNKAKLAAMAKAMAANRPRSVVGAAAAAIDGVAANRLHTTRSMSTMQQQHELQQQQLQRLQQQEHIARYLPTLAAAGAAATANRQWLKSTKFSNNNNDKNWALGQQLQNKQHLMQQQLSTQQQQQLQQPQPYPLMLRHFQLLASNGARQSPPETQLATMDMRLQKQQQQQQHFQQPTTFIDNADEADIDYFFNNNI